MTEDNSQEKSFAQIKLALLNNPHIVIVGNPVAGFTYHGPFIDHDAASEFTEGVAYKFDADWLIAPLHPAEKGN